jgi:UDP:flavonoid glycosyltransferase YjiC (YdhE family)/glycosyltransferase involved in cell wall biosynthesis
LIEPREGDKSRNPVTPRANGIDVDIVMVSDFRFPGGTSTCIAEEIRAQARAGYTTGLLPITAPILTRHREFHPEIMACIRGGMARLLAPDLPVATRLLLLHQPLAFAGKIDLPAIRRDEAVLVVHQPPEDQARETPYYDVAAVASAVNSHFRAEIPWAPVGPAVRDTLVGRPVKVTADDWVNTIDVSAWRTDRSRFAGDRPIIGRHGRPSPHKWPDDPSELLAAYPEADDIEVRVLGGGEVAQQLLGRIPSNWVTYPFGSRHPREFLREIDFFVYYHHPGWIEAFGRTILEAMASGLPCILPGHFERLFGDACLYAQPRDVRDIVRRLYSDPQEYRLLADRAASYADSHFGSRVHVSRVSDLIGPPSQPALHIVAGRGDETARLPSTAAKRVLYFTSNGEGIGHLTRLMAIARRASSSVEPVFLTLSAALAVLRTNGYFAEYLPRHWDSREWTPFLTERLVHCIRRYDISRVIFDGNAPYQGLIRAREETGCPVTWIRRAMWQRGAGETFLKRSSSFDLVVEPGEIAAEYDEGLTVAHRDSVAMIPPIVFLDRKELLSRADARRQLGIPEDNLAVLIQLGSDQSNDVLSILSDILASLKRDDDTRIVLAHSLISSRPPPPIADDRISVLQDYPISRFFPAFDLAISAAGYNSFHELLSFGVPTLFLPMIKETEDQGRRTLYASDRGLALSADPLDGKQLQRGIAQLFEPGVKEQLARALAGLQVEDGARRAAELLETELGA